MAGPAAAVRWRREPGGAGRQRRCCRARQEDRAWLEERLREYRPTYRSSAAFVPNDAIVSNHELDSAQTAQRIAGRRRRSRRDGRMKAMVATGTRRNSKRPNREPNPSRATIARRGGKTTAHLASASGGRRPMPASSTESTQLAGYSESLKTMVDIAAFPSRAPDVVIACQKPSTARSAVGASH